MIFAERALVQNVFMEWVEPTEAGPPPCRTIPVTDEIRARDAAARAAREKRPDWAIKAELSQDNLVLVRRPVGPGRVEHCPRIVTRRPPPPRKEWPRCACGARISWNRTECPPCLKARAARRKCTGCGEFLYPNVKADTCPKCRPKRRKKSAKVRLCSCGRRLRPSNLRDTCFECRGITLSREQRLARRVKCATPECKRLLRFPRKEGLCGVCMDRTVTRKEVVERYRAKKLREGGQTCKVCRVPIKPETKTGCCIKHAAQLRATRVILHAPTKEEHELNVLWASLSLEDKWAVLEDSLEGGQEDAEHCEVSAGS